MVLTLRLLLGVYLFPLDNTYNTLFRTLVERKHVCTHYLHIYRLLN